jgi:hypothetical protein
MKRRELARAIAIASGLSLAAYSTGIAKPGNGPQGYIKSGNPHAAGGPENPGVGNPWNAY